MLDDSWPQKSPPGLRGDVWQWDLSSVAQLPTVRADLRRVLGDAPAVDTDESFEERFLLAFEELASNGLRHGGRPVRARVTATGDGWLIDVSDSLTERPPQPAIGRDPAQGGLGLLLTARLTSAHGWHVTAGRKHVWACCR
ncbi:hypothetical protein FHU33_3596 [Blastococcus colisei]|uniref:Histidine kinase/HSP90-like ATPase domain-containing protein n=1 Tax=Blastococcus colisei TaxID=1564162 RepID=A0A543PJ60_9ACTN|nr:ATP-binding protein [Blastococcus colisei]TQN44110.1 hypothetical protein FHU33_3596 [Blastococcus colisei]